MYDLIIIGGGPAGSAAAVYAARKQLKTLFLTAEWGGQSIVSPDIQNWIGTPSISGDALAKSLRAHVEAYAGTALTVMAPRKAVSLTSSDTSVTVVDDKGDSYEARAALVATGSIRRKLEIPGADIFDQKGLTYCASCDGPLFAGADVVVVGGGNAAFETAAQLLAYTKSVTMLNRGDSYRADQVTVDKVLSYANMKAIQNVEPTEVVGEQFVTGIKYKDMKTGEEALLPVTGVFVEIGLIPNTEWLGDAVALNAGMHIIADPRTQRAYLPRPMGDSAARHGVSYDHRSSARLFEATSSAEHEEGVQKVYSSGTESGDESVLNSTMTESQGPHNEADGLSMSPRVWAAGDCTNAPYHQNNIAAGDAVKAVEDIFASLHAR